VNADGTLMVTNHVAAGTGVGSVISLSPGGSRVLDLQPPGVARALSADGSTLIGRSGSDEDALWALAQDGAFQLVLPRLPGSAAPPQVALTDVSSGGQAMSGTGVPSLWRDRRRRAFLVTRP
jgi:hypothetical protein